MPVDGRTYHLSNRANARSEKLLGFQWAMLDSEGRRNMNLPSGLLWEQ